MKSPKADANAVPVLLIQMPFAPVSYPSIALSLLKATLALHGTRAEVLYLNLRLARMIGLDAYSQVSEVYSGGHYNQAGDWAFSGCLFAQSEDDVEEYVENILRKPAFLPDGLLVPAPESFIRAVMRARRRAHGFVEKWARWIADRGPRIIAFSSVLDQHVACLALAKRVKAMLPQSLTVFGGDNCEGAKGLETARQFPFVDAVVSGEGEVAFSEIVQRHLRGEPLTGLAGVISRWEPVPSEADVNAFSAPPVRCLDDVPIPDYRDYFQQLDGSRVRLPSHPTILMETSRGCWWGEKSRCTFCNFNGPRMAFRAKSSSRAREEIRQLSRQHPGVPLLITDNIMAKEYPTSLLPDLASLKLPVALILDVKTNLPKEQFVLLRDANVKWVVAGIESLSDAILKLMRKGVSAFDNIQTLKWGKEFGVEVSWNLLWGFPAEPSEAYERMTEIVPLLTHLQPPQGCGQILLGRFSPLFENADHFGLRKVTPSPAYRYIYPFDERALTRLAKYFLYDYRSPQDIDAYTSPLLDELRSWCRVHEESELTALDLGHRLLIWDQRLVARARVTVLTGTQRVLYMACDQAQDSARLRKIAGEEDGKEISREDLESLLQPLLEGGLMLREGNRFLSLAVLASEPPIRKYVGEKIAAHLERVRAHERYLAWRSRVRIRNPDQDPAITSREMSNALGSAGFQLEPSDEPFQGVPGNGDVE